MRYNDLILKGSMMSRSPSFPAGCEIIRTYEEFGSVIEAFSNEHLDLLLIIGTYGSGKSKTLRKAIGDKALIINGRNTPMMVYTDLYHARNRPVLIDDCESMLEQKAGKELLRNLCETDAVKEISWNTASMREVPKKFKTSSKVCIICNRWVDTDSVTGAIQDRAHLYAFQPHASEIHNYVSEWFEDAEILAFFEENLEKIQNPSARQYVKTLQQKKANRDWQEYARQFFNELRITDSLEIAFANGEISRATYYRRRKEIRDRAS